MWHYYIPEALESNTLSLLCPSHTWSDLFAFLIQIQSHSFNLKNTSNFWGVENCRNVEMLTLPQNFGPS